MSEKNKPNKWNLYFGLFMIFCFGFFSHHLIIASPERFLRMLGASVDIGFLVLYFSLAKRQLTIYFDEVKKEKA